MKILLISGHGAGDVGACGCGYQEYALTRELVNTIAPELRAFAIVDIYDQARNAFYDVQNGTFNIGSYDYVLEVHFNAFNGAAYGTEIFVTDREKVTTVETEIMKNMGAYFTVRGVKTMNFLVINTVKSRGISSALIETCFIDNQSDMDKYQANKDAVANAIVKGIVDGFELGEVSRPADKPAPAPQPLKWAVGTPVCVSSGYGTPYGVGLINGDYEGTITQIELGAPYPYLIDARMWVNDTLIDADPHVPGNARPTSSGEKYSVGDPVCTNTLAASSTGGQVYKGDWKGKITRVVAGAPYPYLLNNGTGWTNDAGIDSDPHDPR